MVSSGTNARDPEGPSDEDLSVDLSETAEGGNNDEGKNEGTDNDGGNSRSSENGKKNVDEADVIDGSDNEADKGDAAAPAVAEASTQEEGVEVSEEDSKKKKATFKEGDVAEEEQKSPIGNNGDDDEEAQVISPTTSGADGDNKTRELSPIYYCPITKLIFQDPVLTPDGETYERTAIIEERGEEIADKLYPNRALKVIIDEELSMLGDSLRSKLLRMQRSMKSNLSKLLEQSVIPSKDHRVLPDAYYCPITFELMNNPMIDKEGNTYDRRAIKKWIKSNHDSPLTRSPLRYDELYPNLALKELLDEEKNKSDGSIHPSIRRWKEQTEAEGDEDDDSDDENVDDPVNGGSGRTRTRIPLTREELERLERQRKCQQITSLGVCITFFLVFVYFPGYLFAFIIVYWILLWVKESSEAQQRQNAQTML